MNKTLTFIIVSTINVFYFFVDSYSQNEFYYWNQGKKIHIVEKANLYILYEGFDDNILNDSTIKLLQKGYSTYTGNYIIIESVKNLDCKNEFVHQSYVTEYRDTIFPTKNLLLKLSDEHSNNRLNEICEKYDLKILDTRYRVNKLQSKKFSEVFQIANTIYESEIEVDWCHPAFVEKQRLDFNPTDKQYYLHNVLHEQNTWGNDINALEAWQITKGCPNIRVAVLDDGVENHSDLNNDLGVSRVLEGYTIDNINLPAYGRPGNSAKHGQACAGIIAASHSVNIRGVAPNISIIPVNLGFEYQEECEWYDAMNWAWDPAGGNADVLSNSWGPASGATGRESYLTAIENAKLYGRGGDIENHIYGRGAIVVFASGNNGLNEVSDYAKVSIAVGAIDKYDTPAKSFNGVRYTNIGSDLDLVAYGGSAINGSNECDIRVIDRVGSYGYTTGTYYDNFGGTSAACPMVSGAAALILSINPNLTRTQVESILFNNAKDLGISGRDNTYGYGKLDIFKACQAAVETRANPFYMQSAYIPYTKIRENALVTFSSSPNIYGLSSGTYYCDVYKLSLQSTSNIVYLGDGLSGATSNDGKYYVNISESGNINSISTFFYYIKNSMSGQTVNQWAPQDPTNLLSRKYLKSYSDDVTYSEILYPLESEILYANSSITFLPGTDIRNGASLIGKIVSTQDDIPCLPNPTQPIQLKKYFVDIQDTILSPLKQETLEEQGITIYPNPCKGNFYVDMNNNIAEKTQIDIYTLQGEKVFSSYINHNQENIVFTKEKGVYIIKIKNEKIVWSGKIVLQ